jgi:hypothetical protein
MASASPLRGLPPLFLAGANLSPSAGIIYPRPELFDRQAAPQAGLNHPKWGLLEATREKGI